MRVITSMLIFAFMLASVEASPPSDHVKVSGTYSNLKYNEEGGDLLGIEIKIIPVGDDRFQAAVIVSEGAPAPMVLVDVRVANRSISFKVPTRNRDFDDSWSFQGTLSAKALKGTITHGSGGKEQVTLQRGCGYWDR